MSSVGWNIRKAPFSPASLVNSPSPSPFLTFLSLPLHKSWCFQQFCLWICLLTLYVSLNNHVHLQDWNFTSWLLNPRCLSHIPSWALELYVLDILKATNQKWNKCFPRSHSPSYIPFLGIPPYSEITQVKNNRVTLIFTLTFLPYLLSISSPSITTLPCFSFLYYYGIFLVLFCH